MSEENISPETSKEASVAETAAQPSETVPGLTELDRRMADDLSRATIEEFVNTSELLNIMRQGRFTGGLRGASQLVGEGIVGALRNQDARGRELAQGLIDAHGEDLKIMTISASEYEQLSDKTTVILQEAALAHERIAKDQEEIEQLKMETRALLTRLRAP